MSTVQQEGEAETKQPPALQHMKSQAQHCKTDPGAWRPGLSPIKGSTVMVSPPGWGQFRGRACDSKGPSQQGSRPGRLQHGDFQTGAAEGRARGADRCGDRQERAADQVREVKGFRALGPQKS